MAAQLLREADGGLFVGPAAEPPTELPSIAASRRLQTRQSQRRQPACRSAAAARGLAAAYATNVGRARAKRAVFAL